MRTPLLAALGLLEIEEDAIPTKQQGLLVDHLETMLRGGVSLSLAEWLTLSDDERVALAEAGDRIRGEEADAVAESLVARLEGTVQRAEVELAAERAAGGAKP